MAAAIVQQGPDTVPGASVQEVDVITLDTSYPNPAGYVFTAASFGLSILKKVIFAGSASLAAGAFEPVIIPTYATDGSGNILSFALHLIVGTTGVEVANAVNVSTVALTFVIEGN